MKKTLISLLGASLLSGCSILPSKTTYTASDLNNIPKNTITNLSRHSVFLEKIESNDKYPSPSRKVDFDKEKQLADRYVSVPQNNLLMLVPEGTNIVKYTLNTSGPLNSAIPALDKLEELAQPGETKRLTLGAHDANKFVTRRASEHSFSTLALLGIDSQAVSTNSFSLEVQKSSSINSNMRKTHDYNVKVEFGKPFSINKKKFDKVFLLEAMAATGMAFVGDEYHVLQQAAKTLGLDNLLGYGESRKVTERLTTVIPSLLSTDNKADRVYQTLSRAKDLNANSIIALNYRTPEGNIGIGIAYFGQNVSNVKVSGNTLNFSSSYEGVNEIINLLYYAGEGATRIGPNGPENIRTITTPGTPKVNLPSPANGVRIGAPGGK